MNKFDRTINLIGEEHFNKLKKANMLIFGVGGVGGYIVEGLIRSGIEKITLVDSDVVTETNINRQIIATTKTIGQDKVTVEEERILSINPKVKIKKIKKYITPENILEIDFKSYDYVIDAIDFVPGKIAIIEEAKKYNKRIISCMGTGNKLHPEMFEITDISKTSVCPLAKKIRQELSKRQIKKVPVLFSKEVPIKTNINEGGKQVPSSLSTVPSIAGLLIANYVILDLIK